jgi:hypothetical protein
MWLNHKTFFSLRLHPPKMCKKTIINIFSSRWKIQDGDLAYFSMDGKFLKDQAIIFTLPFIEIPKVIHPKYSKDWLSTLAHTIDCVWSNILNNAINHGVLFSIFNFWVNKHSKLTWKFRMKILIPILLNISVLLDIQPIFCLSAQMALVSTLFQIFIVYTWDV